MSADALARLEQLQALRLRIDIEITAVENGLKVAGVLDNRGRPRVVPTHTLAEAKAAHAAHKRGERSDWIDAGERQYQRERKRDERRVGAA